MIVTVAIVVATHDLSKGVFAGVLLSALLFAWKMSRIRTVGSVLQDGSKHYSVQGQLFFGTMNHFVAEFAYAEDPEHIVIDFSGSHVWDQSAVAGISKVILKYQQVGKRVKIVGLNSESRQLVEKLGLSAPGSH